jgi:hypothetical protein
MEGRVFRQTGEVRDSARVTIECEHWMLPELVSDFFRQIQRELLGRRPPKPPSPRSLALARLSLDAIAQETPRPSWGALMMAWNAKYPEWPYRSRGTFRKDYERARRVVLHPSFDGAGQTKPKG